MGDFPLSPHIEHFSTLSHGLVMVFLTPEARITLHWFLQSAALGLSCGLISALDECV